jgi:WD40 repeat protein
MLITGCNDTNIRLYEVREGGLILGKILEGHEKGIKCLAFSEINKVILSCAFDFDVLVWNAYLDCPVAKLVGHEAPLNSVYCPQKHSIIISLDSKGIMKIWNCKTFQLIQNVVSSEQLVRTSITFSYKEESDLAILCMKRLHFFEFAVSYDPKLTDDKDITAIRYSNINLEIYIGTGGTLKAWSAEKGVVSRTFKNLTQTDIICMELDRNHRRIFVGSIGGDVLSVDAFTGIILNRFAEHTKEVCYVGYSFRHSLLVTAGWDRIIKIHNDTDKLERIDKRNNVLRTIRNCHSKELLLSAYSDDMLLLATTSRDPTVRLWDFEKGYFEGDFTITEEISCIHFLNPFPLLAVSDIKGGNYIFIVNYHKKAGKLLVHWTNMYSIQKESQVTYLSSEYHGNELKLIVGDEYGYVRLIKLNSLLES